jgi:hypothetical protein
MTLCDKLFGFILEDPATHQKTLSEMPADKTAAMMGRKAKFVIEGPEGGVYIVRLTPTGLIRDADDDHVRNMILMSDSTIIEILIWLAQEDLPPERRDPFDDGLDPRSAFTNGLIKISGDRMLYDAEEIFAGLEKHMFPKMKPIALSALAAMRKARSR